MKNLIIVALIIFTCAGNANSQFNTRSSERKTETHERSMVTGGFAIGLGIFYPGEVNEYIEDQTSHLLLYTGIAGMITNFYAKASVNVRPHQIIQVSGFVELAWAPKYIYVDVDNDYYYSFSKISPGVSPKIHIPMGTGRLKQ
jgi:hypothetical protein